MNEVRRHVKMRKFKINNIIMRYIYETENRFVCFLRVLVAALCCVPLEIRQSDWLNHRFLLAGTQILRRLLLELKIILKFRLKNTQTVVFVL